MKLWAWDEKNLPSIAHAIRTAVAATASVIIARLVQMPEAYWVAFTLAIRQRFTETHVLCGQMINAAEPE
jgi:hypothetical protein